MAAPADGETVEQRRRRLDGLQSGRNGRVWTEFVDDVAIVRMDCGENRLNVLFMDALNRCLDEILERPDIKVVVTCGVGKFYSNGLDLNWLKELANASTDDLNSFIKTWHQTLQRILLFPLPTIAAINGHAFAGGAFLALCHDYRVMQTGRGWFSVNEVHLGMQIPEWLIKLTLFRIPGSKARSDVLIFGKRLTAEKALELGVIHKVSNSEALLQDAVAIVTGDDSAASIRNLQREMIQLMKEDAYANILATFDKSVQKRIKANL